MTEFKPKETSSTLLVSGKSSRLLEMRQKSLNLATDFVTSPSQPNTGHSNGADSVINPELLLAQQIIDQQLSKILSSLPAGKQRSLFKIRYGVELDNLKQHSIQQIIKLLKINHPLFTNPRGNIKQVLELTYNGQQP